MDFADVIKILGKAKTAVEVYEANKELLDPVLGAILKKLRRNPKVIVAPAPKPNGGVIVIPEGPFNPTPPKAPAPFYYGIGGNGPWFLEEDNVILPREVFDRVLSKEGPDAQMHNQRMHINLNPLDAAGLEIRTGDPRHPPQPIIRYRWWVDGVENSNSVGEPDRMELESEYDDLGCTPVLRLTRITPGRHELKFQPFVPAELNAGKEVMGKVYRWFID